LRSGGHEDCGSQADEINHFQEIEDAERLGEDHASHGFDEVIDFRVSAMAGHENEAVAEMRTHALDRAVKHIAGKGGHHHVAKDELEVTGEKLMDAFDAVPDGGDFIAVFLEEIGHDFPERGVVFQEQDFVAGGKYRAVFVKIQREYFAGIAEWPGRW
jgi:hypothetical protein